MIKQIILLFAMIVLVAGMGNSSKTNSIRKPIVVKPCGVNNG